MFKRHRFELCPWPSVLIWIGLLGGLQMPDIAFARLEQAPALTTKPAWYVRHNNRNDNWVINSLQSDDVRRTFELGLEAGADKNGKGIGVYLYGASLTCDGTQVHCRRYSEDGEIVLRSDNWRLAVFYQQRCGQREPRSIWNGWFRVDAGLEQAGSGPPFYGVMRDVQRALHNLGSYVITEDDAYFFGTERSPYFRVQSFHIQDLDVLTEVSSNKVKAIFGASSYISRLRQTYTAAAGLLLLVKRWTFLARPKVSYQWVSPALEFGYVKGLQPVFELGAYWRSQSGWAFGYSWNLNEDVALEAIGEFSISIPLNAVLAKEGIH